jgi:thioredoxin 1
MKKFFLTMLFLCNNLFATDQHLVKNIAPQEFEKEVLQACLPVFFQISVSWCPPCKILKPIFEELSVEFKDEAIFVEIDVALEENRDILQTVFQKYGVIIGGFPVIFVFNQGNYINHFNARIPHKEELAKMCNSFIEEIEKQKEIKSL